MGSKLKKGQGRGVACGFWFNIGGQTCVDLNIGTDGTVNLTVGTVDVGGARFPDMAEEVDNGVAVAIDGVIYRDDWTQPIPRDAQVSVMPRIAGG